MRSRYFQNEAKQSSLGRMLGQPLLEKEVAEIVEAQISGDYTRVLTHISYVIKPDAYLRFLRSSEYKTAALQEETLGRFKIPYFHDSEKPIAMIDLGVGDGSEIAPICGVLRSFPVEYLGLDISKKMLAVAEKRDLSGVPNLKSTEFLIGRFDRPELADLLEAIGQRCSGALVLLLGNTLCNFTQPKELIKNIFESVTKAFANLPVRILIGSEVASRYSSSSAYAKEYDTPENRALTVSPLQLIGIAPDCGKISISFNAKKRRVEEWFVVEEDTRLDKRFGVNVISKGTRILTSVTLKPSLDELVGFVSEMAHKDIDERTIVTQSRNGEFAVILAKF